MEDENENDIYKISEALKKENAISDEISINKINNNDINEINTNSNNINNTNNISTNNTQNKQSKFAELQQQTFDLIQSSTKKRRNSAIIRQLVSKDKNRFCYDEFDLDLTYITPNIIAMGKPSTSIEGIYRNKLQDVVEFFNQRHPKHYKVYNLCEENFYPNNTFYQQGSFPFQDHEAPPLNLIHPFCVDAKQFLDLDPKNVVAIHCKAGKGRTGTFISCLLLYLNIFDNAADCLKYYGMMRVENGRGVTVPSQIRYVFYYEQILKQKLSTPISFKNICITKIRMVTVPNISSVKSGCTPTFSIENAGKSFNFWDFNKKQNIDPSESYVDFQINDKGFDVCGDVKITFFHYPMIGSKEKIFKLWFNTNFVPDDGVLIVPKDLIDKACKDKKCKKFKQNFKIEVHCIEY
jgi:phosphatidylinositol-3,4,5-trisphosphate 3-phosphatase/dual-specificity protein phosphatase PTEN